MRSPPAARPLPPNPQHQRDPNIRHQVMHRLGRITAPGLPAPEPRGAPRGPVHGKASILRLPHTHQQPAQRAQAAGRQARAGRGPAAREQSLPRPRQRAQRPRRSDRRPHQRRERLLPTSPTGQPGHAVRPAARRGRRLQHGLFLLHRGHGGLHVAGRDSQGHLGPAVHAAVQGHAEPRRRRQHAHDFQARPQIRRQEPGRDESRGPRAHEPQLGGV